jgi:hypothetical protein
MKIITTGNNELTIYPSYVLSVNSQDWKHYIFKEEYDRRNKIINKMQKKFKKQNDK